MAWVKIPKEHHPIFEATVPAGARVVKMFGGMCGTVNGHMFGGLWAKSAMVRLPVERVAKLLKKKGYELFDPMGRGRPMKDMVVLPASVLKKPKELARFLAEAYEHTQTLPAKKGKKKSTAKKSSSKKKTTTKKTASKKSGAKKRSVKKTSAKKKTAATKKKTATKKKAASKKTAAKKTAAKKRSTKTASKKAPARKKKRAPARKAASARKRR